MVREKVGGDPCAAGSDCDVEVRTALRGPSE